MARACPFAVVRALPESWQGLRSSLAGPVVEGAWSQAAIDALRLEPWAAVVGPPEQPLALAPLALVHGRLETAAAPVFEPVDLLWRDEESLETLVEGLAGLGRPLLLRRVLASSPSLAALRRAWRGLVLERPAGSCPTLRVGEPLSSRRRRDLRHARRRAEARGPVAAELLEAEPAEAGRLLEQAFLVEAAGWKGRRGTALLQEPWRASFYRRYGAAAAEAGTLRLAFLRIGGEPAAMQIMVERDEALWLLKIGYADRFAHCSPGQLLLERTLAWAAERGLARIEFLGEAAPWTRGWTREERACVTAAAYPGNARGAAALARDGGGIVRRRLAR